jgi:di/tricarboxylate transporter
MFVAQQFAADFTRHLWISVYSTMGCQLRCSWKCFVAYITALLALVEMSTDVFNVCSFRPQLDVAQLALKQLPTDCLVHVVLVLCEAVWVGCRKVAFVTLVWFVGLVTDKMLLQLNGHVETFAADVADVLAWSIRIMAVLVVLIK